MRKTTQHPREKYAKKSLLCQISFLRLTLLFVAFATTLTHQLDAQGSNCSLSCTDINISVNMDCEATVTPSMFADTASCPDGDFIVNVYFDGNLIPTSPTVTSEYLDERVTLELVDLVSGNICWSYGYVEDKFPPILTCSDTMIMSCGTLPSFPGPTATDNCGGEATVIQLDEQVELLDCDSLYRSRVTRFYTAVDERGNYADTCAQVFLLERLQEEDIDYPDTLTVASGNPLSCTAEWDLNGNGIPEPLEINSIPRVDGTPLYPYNQFCNTTIVYNDVELTPVHCNRLILRMWSISEWWCSQQVTYNYAQLIEIADTVAPTFVCPDDFTVSAGVHDCVAQVNLPPITATDDCQDVSDIMVDIVYPGGFIDNQNGGIIELSGGVHTIEYRAFDQCGNMANCFVDVTVVDDNPPIAVCDLNTAVSLTLDGVGKIYAETFDDGSVDNCDDVYFKVLRMTTGACDGINGDDNPDISGNQEYFDDYVKFCCEDISDDDVLVRFRVYDVDPGDGPVHPSRHQPGGDLHGRFNECMVNVEVQDKLPPQVTCPPDITVSCMYDFDEDDLSVFGSVVTDEDDRQDIIIDDPDFNDTPVNWGQDGVTSDNCVVDVDEIVTKRINSCNIGEITREFIAEDAGGRTASCIQTITIINTDSFTVADITWPLDYEPENEGCDAGSLTPESLPEIYSEPRYEESECDQIATSYTDEVFSFTGQEEACFKIIRTWKVIDWCGAYDDGTGTVFPQWSHQQVIKVINTEGPEFVSGCDSVSVSSNDPDCQDGFIELIAVAEDDCTPEDELEYSYRIDANRDGIFDTPEIPGNDASAEYPIGRHAILWTVQDRCGNRTSCTQNFSIINTKKPTPVCMGLVTVFMESTGTVEIWASDLDKGSYHGCPGIDVQVSFDSVDIVPNMTFDCNDLGENDVQLWVIDEFGNKEFCTVTVEIQDDNTSDACDGFADDGDIMGLISTENDDNVENVYVTLEGGSTDDQQTGENGLFAFVDMPFGGSYSVVPHKNDDPLNGISTYDIVLIQKHIQGIEPFDSPYKSIAADVNNTEEVSALDIVELRKLLLGFYSEFPNNTSWRFIDENHLFSDANDPWSTPFPEEYVIDPFDENMMEADFTAVKIGDVNYSAVTNGLLETENRTGARMVFNLEDKELKRGEIVELPVKIYDAENVEAYQHAWSFNTDVLAYMGIDDLAAEYSADFINDTEANAGIIKTLWYAQDDRTLESEEPIYTLKFMAQRDGLLSEALAIHKSAMKPEAYSAAGEVMNVSLEFRSESEQGQDIVLFQNRPNPFTQVTEISFILDEAKNATITVLDMTGKSILAKTGYFDKGLNVVTLQADELSSSGVLYYRLETEDFVDMKKMILLK